MGHSYVLLARESAVLSDSGDRHAIPMLAWPLNESGARFCAGARLKSRVVAMRYFSEIRTCFATRSFTTT